MNSINEARETLNSFPKLIVDSSKKNLIIALVAGAAAGAIAAVGTFFLIQLTGITPLAATAAIMVGTGVALFVSSYVLKKLNPPASLPRGLQQSNQQVQKLQQTVQTQGSIQSTQAKKAKKELQQTVKQEPLQSERATKELQTKFKEYETEIKEAEKAYNDSITKFNNTRQELLEKPERAANWLKKHPQPQRQEMLKFLDFPDDNYTQTLSDQDLIQLINTEATVPKGGLKFIEVLQNNRKKNYEQQISLSDKYITSNIKLAIIGLTDKEKKAVLAPYMDKYGHLMPK